MSGTLETVFRFLFKYPRLAFERGELVIGFPWLLLLAALLLAAAVPLLLRYRRVGGDATTPRRLLLAGLRAAGLGVLVICLFRPTLLVSTVIPRRNFVGVLLDDSRSMRVADVDDRARAERVREWFAGGAAGSGRVGAGLPPSDSALAPADAAGDPRSGASADEAEGAIRRALEERFRVRLFRFAGEAAPVDGPEALAFSGGRTDLAGALERARQELTGLPVSGLVVVTDGADNARDVDGAGDGGSSLDESLLSLRAAGIPVHTVGLGRERISPDVEVRRVEVPRSVLVGSTLVADVLLSHEGFGGRRVRLDVEDSGRIVGTREVTLSAGGEQSVQVQLEVEESGPRRLRFRVRPLEGEAVSGNNARELLLDARDEREKILYVEGEPRFEIGFLRRAVREDPQIQVTVLLRSAENKFLRLDVDDPGELAAGFPATREELFAYRGLVLGSVEASFFTHDQLRMIADFVSQRGGGLLVLGGRRALSEGGYAGTPLADALPVTLRGVREGGSAAPAGGSGPRAGASQSGTGDGATRAAGVRELRVSPTPAGRRHPALRVAGSEERSIARWDSLPPVTTPNRVGGLKPGAVALLTAPTPAGDYPVLSHQRFGRGRSVAFPVQDTWMWQMHAEIPADDRTHETLWRQLLRWLVADVPERVRVVATPEAVEAGERVALRAEVEDERYLRVNGARVVAEVAGPTGEEASVPLEWTVSRDGEYEAAFRPSEEGIYRIRVRAEGKDAAVGGGPAGGEARAPAPTGEEESGGDGAASSDGPGANGPRGETYIRVGSLAAEQFDAGLRLPLLQRIAEETGGRYYDPETIDALPEEIRYTESGDTVVERRELWDMPALFLLLLGFVGAEWLLRRRWGLA